MSIYTSFDMIADCRGGRPQGWVYFVQTFLPPCRLLLRHYRGGEEALRRFLLAAKGDLASMQPAPERRLMTQFRDRLLEAAGYGAEAPASVLDLATLEETLSPLTVIERQLVWLDTMDYGETETGAMMQVSPETVARARGQAAELLRAGMDHWTRTVVRDNGPGLGRQARSRGPEEPVPFRQFIEIIDGRLGWQGRAEVERKLLASWHEVDHFCRIREADTALRGARPLGEDEAVPYLELLGVEAPKRSFWRRVLSSR